MWEVQNWNEKKKKITRWLNSTFEISKEKIGELADGSIDIVFEEQKEKRWKKSNTASVTHDTMSNLPT